MFTLEKGNEKFFDSNKFNNEDKVQNVRIHLSGCVSRQKLNSKITLKLFIQNLKNSVESFINCVRF